MRHPLRNADEQKRFGPVGVECTDPVGLNSVAEFRRALLRWSKSSGRCFFWREPGFFAFGTLIVEMLLTRTIARAVEPVARRLLNEYPDAERLAGADLARIERTLHPLGLHRKRAQMLLLCAQAIVERHDTRVPFDSEDLMALPYVGRYTASAVRCFAFGFREAVIDANVSRIYQRVFSLPASPLRLALAHDLWEFGNSILPRKPVKEFNWALLDLGGTICSAKKPACDTCPVAEMCQFRQKRVQMC
jgi:A/G-specific adenine glycosylase